MLLALALVLTATTAAGQPSSKEGSPIAEALFRDGRRLLKEGDLAPACAKFEESYRIERKLGTLLNLANCHAKLGRTASAWSEFTSAASIAARQGHGERQAYAKERAEKLEARLSRVTIIHRGATPGLIVDLGGKKLETATLGTAFPVDPGEVEVTATAKGMKTWKTVIEVPHGPAQLEVIVPALEPGEDAVAKPLPAPPPLPGPRNPNDGTTETSVHFMVWAGVALAGAGLVIGGVTGGLALSDGGSLNCPNDICAIEDSDQLERAQTLALVSNVSFVAAGIGAAVGAVGLVLTFSASGEDSVEALLGPGFVGFRGAF